MWFLKRQVPPEELVSGLVSATLELTSTRYARIQKGTAGVDKISLEIATRATTVVATHLQELGLILIGDAEIDPDESRGARVAAAAAAQPGFAAGLVSCLDLLPLEQRKSAAHVFANLVNRTDTTDFATVIAQSPIIISSLTNAYKDETADLALIRGMMLREAARHAIVAKSLLEAPNFWLFFFIDLVRLKSFEVTSDAFELLKVLLMGHGVLAARFIQKNYTAFVCHFNLLLQSSNYVTCRESIRLLGELLLQRENFSIMMNYISDRENLKILMNLLRCKRKRIQIEAFHVFKVFVANPRKPVDITHILHKNRDKLVTYLRNFHIDKDADAQFAEEKALVVETLLGLEVIER